MWDKITNSILYYLKTIQITFKTWKNAIEIARAYSHPSRFSVAPFLSLPKGIRQSFLAIIGILVFCVLTFTAIKFRLFSTLLPRKTVPVVSIQQQKTRSATGEESEEKISVEKKIQEVVQPPVPIKPKVKIVAFQPSDDTADFLILVANKAVKTMYLLQQQKSIWQVVREYSIAIGEQEGRKRSAGDRRTPEGYYFIVGRKERSQLAVKYGPLAYILNYPNTADRNAGRTGQGIWIHGTDPDSLPLETRGCIEMENSALEDLSTLLKSGIGTPVVIVNDSVLTDPTSIPDYTVCENRRQTILQEYQQAGTQFAFLVVAWKSAWEKKDINNYETFYDTVQFQSQGLNWSSWKERKLRTFDLYDTIAISVENIIVTDFTDSETTVKFFQTYKTNLNRIENAKRLTFEKIDDSWRIVLESTCPKEELLL
jgi:murein L,D-transpeptidase YafK